MAQNVPVLHRIRAAKAVEGENRLIVYWRWYVSIVLLFLVWYLPVDGWRRIMRRLSFLSVDFQLMDCGINSSRKLRESITDADSSKWWWLLVCFWNDGFSTDQLWAAEKTNEEDWCWDLPPVVRQLQVFLCLFHAYACKKRASLLFQNVFIVLT